MGEFVSSCGRHSGEVFAADALARINSAGCEAGQLASLMEVLAEHLDQAKVRVDPGRTAKVGADVARIAHGCSARLSGQMIDVEERCCAMRKRQAPE